MNERRELTLQYADGISTADAAPPPLFKRIHELPVLLGARSTSQVGPPPPDIAFSSPNAAPKLSGGSVAGGFGGGGVGWPAIVAGDPPTTTAINTHTLTRAMILFSREKKLSLLVSLSDHAVVSLSTWSYGGALCFFHWLQCVPLA
jgi:hypothetical protein